MTIWPISHNHYKRLGIARNATSEDIKKAFRGMAFKYHPDRNPGNDKWANFMFRKINESYKILSDSDKRASYDILLGSIIQVPHKPSKPLRTTPEDLARVILASDAPWLVKGIALTGLFADIYEKAKANESNRGGTPLTQSPSTIFKKRVKKRRSPRYYW